MGQIDYPKQTKPKRVVFGIQKQNEVSSKKTTDLELELDELKTNNNRIDAENEQRDEEIDKKQDTLQFDNVPTQNSVKPVKSGGIYNALSQKQDILQFDDTPTENSQKLLKSGKIFDALSTKQNTITAGTGITIQNDTVAVDTTTVATKTDLAGKQDALTLDNTPTRYSDNAVKSGGVFDALAFKQDVLIIDTIPKQNSTNPITSGGVYSALNSKQDTLTAGTNITIENNIISSTANGGGYCNCASDIADLQNDIHDINAQLLILQTKINNNSAQYNETIFNEYDVYNRAFDLSALTTLYCPNIVFTTEPLLTTTNQNNETETEQVKITTYIELVAEFDTAGDYTFNLYEGSTQISQYSKTISAEQVNTEQTIKFTTNHYSSDDQHNYYVIISKAGGLNGYIRLLNQKMEIVAPNVIIQNKVKPFEVSYNYYTGKYYLSDCTSGFAKLAEIDASNLHSTSDIVWTQTNIEAQNYKTYYIGATDNTTTTLGKRYAIITKKDDTISIIDMDTSVSIYDAPRGTYNISPTFTKHNYSLLFRNTISANSSQHKYFFLNQNGTVSNNSTFSFESDVARTEVVRNNINYLADPASWITNFTIFKNGKLCYYVKNNFTLQSPYNYVDDAKMYIKRCINSTNLDFYCFYKTFGQYYILEGAVVNNSFRFTTDSQLLGTYQDFFMGANNDYFVVVNNTLQYCTNLIQS